MSARVADQAGVLELAHRDRQGRALGSNHLVATHLVRYSTDSADVPVNLERFASPWPSHFAVLGIPTTPGQDLLNVWPPGQYRLDLTFNPGGITRTVDIQITSPLPGL